MKKLSHLDFIGDIPGLRFFGNSQFKSSLGGICSFLIIIFSIYVYSYYVMALLNRDRANMIFQKSPNKNNSIIFNETTNLGVAVYMNNSRVLRNDIFNITISFITNNISSGNQISSKLEIIQCKDDDIFHNRFQSSSSFNNNLMICPKFNMNYPLSRNLENNPSFLQISVDICKNNNLCLNPTEIKTIMSVSKPTFIVYYYDISANFNKEMPFDSFINTASFPLNLNFNKNAEISFVEVEAKLDNAYIFVEESSEFYINLEDYKVNDFDFYTVNSNLLNINLVPSKNRITISRSFMKLSDLFSLSNGITLFLYFLLSFFSKYVNSLIFMKEMIEKLFESNENLKLDEKFYRFTNILVDKLPETEEKEEEIKDESINIKNNEAVISNEEIFNFNDGEKSNLKKPNESKQPGLNNINSGQLNKISVNVENDKDKLSNGVKLRQNNGLLGSKFVSIKNSMERDKDKKAKKVIYSEYQLEEGNFIII